MQEPMPLHIDIVSHRGGTFLWPENSLEAFRATLSLPVEQAECDVHLSADGVPVVIHDAVLNRLTDQKGDVSARTAGELAGIRLRGARGGSVPSLAEVAALFTAGSMQLQVEIKNDAAGRPYPGLLDRSLGVLDSAGIRPRCRIITFDAEIAAAAQQAGGLAGVIWLFEAVTLGWLGADGIIAVAKTYGLRMVETEIGALNAETCARLRHHGLGVAAWGANHADSLDKAFALGLDAVATDDPVLALQLRKRGL
jgi:glycerophosphoryl diester phosphodiesterase